MITAEVRAKIQDKLVHQMTKMDWKHIRSCNSFRKSNGDWISECVLFFINRGSHLALDTKYFVTNKKIISNWKKISGRIACTPFLFGGEMRHVSDCMKLHYFHRYSEQVFEMDNDIDVFCSDWMRNFNKIGLPFWTKFCSYHNINDVMNAPPYNKMSDLSLSSVNMILRGPIIAYYANTKKDDMIVLLKGYEKFVQEIMEAAPDINKGLHEDFQSTKAAILSWYSH
jgi:hypothetical protein